MPPSSYMSGTAFRSLGRTLYRQKARIVSGQDLALHSSQHVPPAPLPTYCI
jgi:hypothetical protein